MSKVIASPLIGVGIETAWGGAWLMPPAYGQVIADTFFSDSTLAFDAQGHLIPVPSYRMFELGPTSNMARQIGCLGNDDLSLFPGEGGETKIDYLVKSWLRCLITVYH
jgi:hypothetical protein